MDGAGTPGTVVVGDATACTVVVGAGVGGQLPALESMPPHNADGASAMHLYMPWWLYQEQARGELDFARGVERALELHARSTFPWVSANLRDRPGGKLLFAPHLVLQTTQPQLLRLRVQQRLDARGADREVGTGRIAHGRTLHERTPRAPCSQALSA